MFGHSRINTALHRLGFGAGLAAAATLAIAGAARQPARATGSGSLSGGGQWTLSTTANQGADSSFTDVAGVAADDVWAVGATNRFSPGLQTTLAERWNGRRWSVVPTPNASGIPVTNSVDGNQLNAVAAIGSNDVWAVGHSTINNSFTTGSAALVEHWDGRKWSIVKTPNGVLPGFNFQNDLLDVSATAADDVWAVGWNGSVFGDLHRATIQHWNGASWVLTPVPSLGDTIRNVVIQSVTAVSRTDAWALGLFGESADSGSSHPLALHWNGSAWTRVSIPDFTFGATQRVNLTGAKAIASNDVWAVGNVLFLDAQGVTQSRAVTEHWDGRSWSTVAAGDTGSESATLTGLAGFGPGDIWATGTLGAGQHTPLLEHWDGTQWSVQPGPGSDKRYSCGLFGAVAHAGGAETVGACVAVDPAATPPVTPLAELFR